MQTKEIDRNILRGMRTDMEAALKQVGEKYGVAISVGNATFRPENAKFNVEVATLGADGTAVSKYVSDYKRYCEMFDLKPEWLGMPFMSLGTRFTVSGLNMKAQRMPVLAKNDRGKEYKFEAAAVIRHMGGAAPRKPLFGNVPVPPAPAVPPFQPLHVSPAVDPMACTHEVYDFNARAAKPCTNRATTLRDGLRVCASCASVIDEARAELKAEARAS